MTPRARPPIKIDSTKCTGCLICELRCSVRFERAFSPARAAIQVRRLVGGATEYAVALTDRCDACGICVRFCAYGCLVQEREVTARHSGVNSPVIPAKAGIQAPAQGLDPGMRRGDKAAPPVRGLDPGLRRGDEASRPAPGLVPPRAGDAGGGLR